ncbi:MAG: metallopeptidase TldD-related protein [Spirochaetes bacterium]|nr:metallopeptidase TldD-related protein [Spirochaetota bacterium]
MMKDRIIAAIARNNKSDSPQAADWRIVSTSVMRRERYFIRDGTEQVRAVDDLQYSLTLYVDSETGGRKTRGEATVNIQPSLSDAELNAKVRQAVLAASKSKNPWFELPGFSPAKIAIALSGFEKLGERGAMDEAAKALFASESKAGGSPAAAKAPGPRINALELFISREEREFLNSRGQHFKVPRWRGYSEFVVDCPSAAGPVELFDDIEFSEPDPLRLAAATNARLDEVKDRAKAVPLPALSGIPVILRGKEAEEVFGWFFGNAMTTMVFTKASTFSVGANVQASVNGTMAEPLDIWAEPFIAGLVASGAFDADGFPLERTPVIEGGICRNLVGSVRHADWLGLPRKGAFSLFSVSPGKMSLSQFRSKPYLEPVMFSDFRLDNVTGDFGAEMRLAYWFDGRKRIPVTGGSISGSVSEFKSTMRRSSKLALGSRSLCPTAVLLEGLSVTAGA